MRTIRESQSFPTGRGWELTSQSFPLSMGRDSVSGASRAVPFSSACSPMAVQGGSPPLSVQGCQRVNELRADGARRADCDLLQGMLF